jgi:hypothetical protein
MPEINHGVSKQLQAKMMITNLLKLILPRKHTLYRSKTFVKDVFIIKPLSPPLSLLAIPRVFFDVRDHFSIENLLPIVAAIISRIKASHASFKRSTNALKIVFQKTKGLSKQRTFRRLPEAIVIGDRTLQLRSTKATTFSLFICLWPLNPKQSPLFFSHCRCTISMGFRRVQ